MFRKLEPAVMKLLKGIRNWLLWCGRVFAREWNTVLHDQGVLVFFVVLPIIYPVIYTLIYNPEVLRDIDIIVVDQDRTARSRQLVRDASAAPAIRVYDYAADMPEARRWMAEGKAYGILYIPKDFGKEVGRFGQAHATFYCEMSLLLRYRDFMSALSDVQLKEIAEITQERKDMLGVAGTSLGGLPIENQAHMVGDTEQGFASFLMPGIIVLILQQAMLLGICMLGGASHERRRVNGGYDPTMVAGAPLSATVWGRTLCYFTFFLPFTIWILHWVPEIFSLPHVGEPSQYLLFIVPMLLATGFLGQTINYFVTDRESSFVVLVVSSVLFLFLTGLTWPRYASPGIWKVVGDFVPGVWGVQGFISISSTGGDISSNATQLWWMWGLTLFYFVTSMCVLRLVAHKARRLYGGVSTERPSR